MVAPDTEMRKLKGTALPEVEEKLNIITKSNERRQFGKDATKPALKENCFKDLLSGLQCEAWLIVDIILLTCSVEKNLSGNSCSIPS